MSWNECLYLYARERGGEYFGGLYGGMDVADGFDGMLLLEHRGQPVIVKCRATSGRYGSSYTAQVLLRCTLERRYQLSVSAKGAGRQGLNTVLGQLDKGAGLLNKNLDLYRDYGCPEVTGGRTIRTDDGEFTQMVFRDLEFRNALLENSRFRLRVKPSAPSFSEDLTHLVSVKCDLLASLYSQSEDWNTGDGDEWLSGKDREQFLREGNFSQRLDALISFAKAAHGAVTAWRMPAKND